MDAVMVWSAVPNSPGCNVMLTLLIEIEMDGSESAKTEWPIRLHPKMIPNRKSPFKITFFLHTLIHSILS